MKDTVKGAVVEVVKDLAKDVVKVQVQEVSIISTLFKCLLLDSVHERRSNLLVSNVCAVFHRDPNQLQKANLQPTAGSKVIDVQGYQFTGQCCGLG